MKYPFITLVVFISTLVVPVCKVFAEPLAGERVLLDGVAAYVNDAPVTIGEVLMMLNPVQRKLEARYDGEELRRRLAAAYQETLDMLVERALIVQAYESMEQKIPEHVIDGRMDEIIQEQFNDDREQLMELLAQDGMSLDAWRENVRRQIIVSSMRGTFVDDNAHVSPAAVRKYYHANMDKFGQAGLVKLRMIVIDKGRTPEDAARSRQQADDLRRRAVEGEDFAVLATRYSSGSRAEQGGDWGWIDPAAMLRNELAESVAALAAAELSPVVDVADKLYILKVEGRREPAVALLGEVEEDIRRLLQREKSEQLYAEWMKKLKKNAVIRMMDRGIF